MRRSLAYLLALLALPATALGSARAVADAEPARLVASGDGRAVLTSAHAGRALLSATHLAPGSSVSGTVELRNVGDVRGDVRLEAPRWTDEPGSGGAPLSERLRIEIRDGARADVVYYDGALSALRALALGTLEPGASRRLILTARFPQGADPAADNPYAGGRSTVALRWTASTAESPGPTPTTTTPDATSAPVAPIEPEPAPPTTEPAPLAPDLDLKQAPATHGTVRPSLTPAPHSPPTTQLSLPAHPLSAGRVSVLAACSATCRLRVAGTVRIGRRTFAVRATRSRATAPGVATIRLSLPRALRRAIRIAARAGRPQRLHVTLTARPDAGAAVTLRVPIPLR